MSHHSSAGGEILNWLFLLFALLVVAPYLLTIVANSYNGLRDDALARQMAVNPGLTADFELAQSLRRIGGY
jgi:hypothetical protein